VVEASLLKKFTPQHSPHHLARFRVKVTGMERGKLEKI